MTITITRRYEGTPTGHPHADVLATSVWRDEGRGGWDSREQFQRVRLPELRRIERYSHAHKTPKGVMFVEPLTGVCEGVIRIEDIEIE